MPIIQIVAAVLGVVSLVLLILWLVARSRLKPFSERTAALEGEVRALRAKLAEPPEHEYRIEQYNVLWFPRVKAPAKQGGEPQGKPGVPHCPKCIVPLKAGEAGRDWSCPKCDFHCPASVTDVVVMDSVLEIALRYFKERPPQKT